MDHSNIEQGCGIVNTGRVRVMMWWGVKYMYVQGQGQDITKYVRKLYLNGI